MNFGWESLPEPVLIIIFRLLPARDVAECGRVCRCWYNASRDEMLWKRLAIRDFKMKHNVTLRNNLCSWQNEYIRLTDAIPRIKVQTIKVHMDEVVHVAFSHDGQDFASSSKDHQVNVFARNGDSGEYKTIFFKDMSMYNWCHTWAAQYSPNDTKLMVSGVVASIGGEVAIFSTGRTSGDGKKSEYKMMCRVINDPYDILGSWFTDDYFLSGTMLQSIFGFEAFIWLCAHSKEEDALVELPGSLLKCYKRLLFKFRNRLQGGIYARYLMIHDRKQFDQEVVKWSPPDVAGESPMLEGLEFVPETNSEGVDEHALNSEQMCLIFKCGNLTMVPHQLGFQRLILGNETPVLNSPERIIDMKGQVVGMATSPDDRYLYVNVRSWPENAKPTMEQPPPISNQVELKVVDLKTLTMMDTTLVGHKGFTSSEGAFYLYIDVSTNLVTSGSEDGHGYLWDRHYTCNVAKLKHDACVNSVGLNPRDEEMCVTASDDNTICVWSSPRRIRESKKSS